MPQGRWLIAVLLIAVFPPAGCGHSSARTTPPKTAKPGVNIPLPEWAPKNPSPEFLRAARVIKPMPDEVGVARDKGDMVGRAWSEKYHRTIVAAWEFFGSLTDQQIERFVTTKKLRLLAKDLSPQQRAAMYHYFDVFRETMRGVPVDYQDQFGEDWLVELYRLGAKQNLSNVEITLEVRGSHRVAIIMRVQLAGGKLSAPCPAGIGEL
jgi:uncharacterized protein YcgL (UPF0745 family)